LDLVKQTNVSLNDFIKACAHVGTEQYKADLVATTLAQQLHVAKATVKCFDCEEEGLKKKQCPKNKQGKKTPSKPCPRCRKGFHWSNECHSKFDEDGNPLPQQGNSKRGS
ncbi:GAK5 protein, partial [Melanocharis versteri]|nr:GAK5 protein [Melanocharis versteri]